MNRPGCFTPGGFAPICEPHVRGGESLAATDIAETTVRHPIAATIASRQVFNDEDLLFPELTGFSR